MKNVYFFLNFLNLAYLFFAPDALSSDLLLLSTSLKKRNKALPSSLFCKTSDSVSCEAREISDKFKNLIISTGATYDSEIKKTFEK